jgi:hypothetical protein
VLDIVKTHSGRNAISVDPLGVFSQGDTGDTYTVTVSNQSGAGGGATSGTVTVTDTVTSSGMTLTGMQGTGWSCAIPTCTRSDALAGGSSYPPITATVNVGATANQLQVNSATVSGGASPSTTVFDATAVFAAGGVGPAVTFPVPSSGTQDVSTTPTLSWSTNGPATCNLDFGSTSSPPQYATGIVSNSYTFNSPLNTNAVYYWSVNCSNQWGTAYSSTISFTTAPAMEVTIISLGPSSIPSGASAILSVGINQPAPAGGLTINLSSSNQTAFPLPATLFIPQSWAGEAIGVTAGTVSSSTTVTLGASYNGSNQTTTVTVIPTGTATTITSSPSGLALVVDSAACTAPCTYTWTPGTNHTIAVSQTTQQGGSGTQYVLPIWSDGGATSHSIVAPSSPTTYTAAFTTQYTLTTAVNPSGAGTITLNPQQTWYNSGAAVSVSASANSGNQFTGFTGNLTGTPSPQTLNVTAPMSVTAQFAASGYTISGQVTLGGAGLSGVTLSLTGTSSGQATTPASGNYAFAVQAGSYTVTPSLQGYTFSPASWNITITSASQSGANFAAQTSGPVLTSFAPSSAAVGAAVTISGSNFGTTQGTVTFNGTAASISAWGNASITAAVPNGLSPGQVQVVVTANGNASAPMLFTVTASQGYTISGVVTSACSTPIAGVTISVTGPAAATTGATGAYSFSNLPAGDYVVTPSMTSYTFTPPSWTFSSLNANETASFTATSAATPTREYVRLGGRVVAIANCGAQ